MNSARCDETQGQRRASGSAANHLAFFASVLRAWRSEVIYCLILHIKCGESHSTLLWKQSPKTQSLNKHLGIWGLEGNPEWPQKGYFSQLTESKETIMFQWKKLPLARSTVSGDQAQKDTYTPVNTLACLHTHTHTHTHTANTHT